MTFRPGSREFGVRHCDAVLLDAAGTLIRPVAPVRETYYRTAERFGLTLDDGKLAQAFGEVFRDMPPLAFAWSSRDELQRLEREWWRTLVRRVIARAGSIPSDIDGFFNALYRHYAEGAAWECFPEVPRLLQGLRECGCKLAVVSNFDSRLPGILRALDLFDQVDAVVYSSEAGSAKPDPDIFDQALDALGVFPHRAIHVGDNAAADLAGAAAAGIVGVLIQRDRTQATVSPHEIVSLDALLPRVLGVAKML